MAAIKKIISTAPGRAGIIGNPTDMYGGAVISCSIKDRAKVTIIPDTRLTLVTAGDVCEISNEHELELRGDLFDIARSILKYLGLPKVPYRIEFESSVPFRSGLSGSTALLVALLQGMLAWMEKYPNNYQLAEMARFIEYKYLNIVCGFQDAYMCVFGGLNYLDFRGKQFNQNGESELFANVRSVEVDNNLPFFLATTGVQRVSGAVHKPLGERWLLKEPKVVGGYSRIAELAGLGRTALINSDWQKLGELMNENHQIQSELAGQHVANERLISAALHAGALGAKLAGAGEGGTVIILYPEEETIKLKQALRTAGAFAISRPAITRGATLN